MNSQPIEKTIVYPNPFKLHGKGHEYITFCGKKLTIGTTIKIYTVAGELVKTLYVESDGLCQKIWHVDNNAGEKVASGIYIYIITNSAGEKCTGKIGIIR